MSSRNHHQPSARRRLTGLLGTSALVASFAVTGAVPTVAQEGSGSVVVTTEVLGSVVSQLVGDGGEVSVIMPSGANPHSYEPSARDAERMLGADVLVSNGLDLEEALLPVLEAADAEGVTWFQAAEHITLRDLEHEAGDDDADRGTTRRTPLTTRRTPLTTRRTSTTTASRTRISGRTRS